MKEAKEYMQQELEKRPPTRVEQSSGMMTRRSRDDAFLRVSRDTSKADSQWKLVSFHSPRYTHQGHTENGQPALKPGCERGVYRPENKVTQLSSVGAQLQGLSVGQPETKEN